MNKPRRRRRWFLIAVAIGLVVLAPVAVWVGVVWQGSSELGRVRRELDASDPGWKLDALLAAGDAARPPDDQNSVVLMNEVAAKTLFAWVKAEYPGQFGESHRRTFERRVRH